MSNLELQHAKVNTTEAAIRERWECFMTLVEEELDTRDFNDDEFLTTLDNEAIERTAKYFGIAVVFVTDALLYS